MKRATLKQTKSSMNTANYTVRENHVSIFEVRSNYIAYTIQWQQRFFTVYPVALGRQGFKLPIYEHGRQIALVEKGNVVRNLLDQYELYTHEDNLLCMVILFACFYDRAEHSHSGEMVLASKEYTWGLS